MRFSLVFGAFALAAALSSSAHAEDIKAGALIIHQPWARATPAGAPVAGGYATIENTGDQADTLESGSFSASKGFAIHQMSMKDGVMSMGMMEGGLVIPAHASVTLDPASIHLMFTGLQHQLRRGDHIAGTLVFQRAGKVDVTFIVEAIGAKAPEPAHQ